MKNLIAHNSVFLAQITWVAVRLFCSAVIVAAAIPAVLICSSPIAPGSRVLSSNNLIEQKYAKSHLSIYQ